MARVFCPADVEFDRWATVALFGAGAGTLITGFLVDEAGVPGMGLGFLLLGTLTAGYTVLAERAVRRRQAIPLANRGP